MSDRANLSSSLSTMTVLETVCRISDTRNSSAPAVGQRTIVSRRPTAGDAAVLRALVEPGQHKFPVAQGFCRRHFFRGNNQKVTDVNLIPEKNTKFKIGKKRFVKVI